MVKNQAPRLQLRASKLRDIHHDLREIVRDLQEIVRDPGIRTIRRLRPPARKKHPEGPAPSARSEIDSCSTWVLAYATREVSVYDRAADPASVQPVRWRASSLSF